MPIYEFKCVKCQRVSEFIQSLSDPTPSKCLKCGAGPLQKIMSRPARTNRLTDWDAEYEQASMEKGNKPLSEPLPDNMAIDDTGHLVELDPHDPETKKKKDQAS